MFNYAAAASSRQQSLDVPSRSLSRHRRFIAPKNSGWTFTFRARFALRIPLDGNLNAGSALTAAAPFQFVYNLDNGYGTLTAGKRKRRAALRDVDPTEELAENERERYEMIGHMERLLAAHVDEAEGDGHACMLKALCQVAQVSSYTITHPG